MTTTKQILGIGTVWLGIVVSGSASEAKKHWAFQPVKRPVVPQVRNANWVKGDIDRFVLARLEQAKLQPAGQATRLELLRRISFALTGLPPMPKHLAKFSDSKTDLSQYVDTLMALSQFGERWGRHWLDHVRFRPFGGKNLNNDPYRQWVLRAFNEDMPYSLFLKMQIAGDLMPGTKGPDTVNLNGMVAVRPFSLKNRHRDQLDLLGRTFMGLSLVCARCHDHKHEPLSRLDYYALQGLFESSRVVELPFLEDKKKFDAYRKGLAEKEANEKKLKTAPLKDYGRVVQLMDLRARIERERAKLQDPKEAKNHDKIRKNIEKFEKDDAKREAEIKKRKLAMDAPEVTEYRRIRDAIKAFDDAWKNVFLFDAFVDQADAKMIADARPPKEGVVVKPGEQAPKDDPVPRQFPVVLAGNQQKPLGTLTHQSGRLELAEWLTDGQHPITARLMVNRVWYHLLGEGLTPSLSNLGHSGQPPTHPLLLDYLSDEFVRNGWSMKRLIRSIVLSATYQQSSEMKAHADELERRLKLFGLARVRRLEVESIWRTLNSIEHNPEGNEKRRDPPFDMVRELEGLFDGADSSLIVPRRAASISSLQALFFLNSPHIKNSAEKIAIRLHNTKNLENNAARIRQVYQWFYGRTASAEELATAEVFLKELPVDAGKLKPNRNKNAPEPVMLARWQAYLQALMATNEFLFVL